MGQKKVSTEILKYFELMKMKIQCIKITVCSKNSAYRKYMEFNVYTRK